LASMVATMSRGKKAYLQYEPQLSEAISRLSQIREDLKLSIDADADSYKAVMAAYKNAKENTSANDLVQDALKQATSVPLTVAERAREVLRTVDALGPITNPNMKSDLTTAAALACAAIEGAVANVEINLESVQDKDFLTSTRTRVRAVQK
jgi:formiminotetrahydrofolate cyclodeaminase